MSLVFSTTKHQLHINTVLRQGELRKKSIVKKSLTIGLDGETTK